MNEPIFLIQLEGDRYYLSDTDKEGWGIEIGCSLGNQKRLRLRSQKGQVTSFKSRSQHLNQGQNWFFHLLVTLVFAPFTLNFSNVFGNRLLDHSGSNNGDMSLSFL